MSTSPPHPRAPQGRPRAARLGVALATVLATLVAVGAPVVAAAERAAPSAVVVAANRTLSASLTCTTLVVDAGVTLTTNGFNILCSGAVTNHGTITTGAATAVARPTSFGGSGGGATGSGSGSAPSAGLRTLAPGGADCNAHGCTAGAGSTPAAPAVSTSLVTAWVSRGDAAYLAGGDGGAKSPLVRGTGANGLIIEGSAIVAGTVHAMGGAGKRSGSVATGGGGGGVVVLAYGAGGVTDANVNVAGGYTAGTGSAHLGAGGAGRVVLLSAPQRISAPASATVAAGADVSFTAVGTGGAPTPVEKWQVSRTDGATWTPVTNGLQADDSVVTGATTSTLSITTVAPDQNGLDYRATETNGAGAVDSAAAVLTVTYNLGGTAPLDQAVAPGGTATFTSASAGAHPVATEQWVESVDGGSTWSPVTNGLQSDGSTVAGATSTTITITDVADDESAMEVEAAFANGLSTVDSVPASILETWNDGGSPPVSTTVDAEGTATFSSTPTSAHPSATEQWQLSTTDGATWTPLADGTLADGSVVSGSATTTLQIANAQIDENGDEVRATYDNVIGIVPSSAAALTVQWNHGGGAPTALTSDAGQTATFTTAPAGANPVAAVTWQLSADGGTTWSPFTNGLLADGSVVAGATTTQLSISDVQPDENGDVVRASYANAVDTLSTTGAALTVQWNLGGGAPTSATADLAATASFTSSSVGANPVACEQWQVSTNGGSTWSPLADGAQSDGSSVAGATTSEITITAVAADENGELVRAQFANADDTVSSATASLTVLWNDGATAPGSQTVDAGQTATFTSNSTGANPVPAEQWQVSTNGGASWTNLANGAQGDGSSVAGATSVTVTWTTVGDDATGDVVRATITNGDGTTTSASALLTVQWNNGGGTPSSVTADEGAPATFTSDSAGANPAPAVRWQISLNDGGTWTDLSDGDQGDGSTVSGSGSDSLSIDAVQPDEDAAQYRAVFTNAAGSVTSAGATLTVWWNDGGSAPESAVANAGQTATFTSSSIGANPVASEQWQVSTDGGNTWTNLANGAQGDGSTVSSATGSTLTIADVAPDENGNEYQAIFSNAPGESASAPATLTVVWNDGGSAPAPDDVDSGQTASFTSTGTGSNPGASEQWQVSSTGGSSWTAVADGAQGDGSSISGATSSTLVVSDAQPDENATEYRAVFANVAGTVNSAAATLTVLYNSGGSAPSSHTVDLAATATFTSSSAGANPAAAEQWRVSSNGGTSWTALANGTLGDGSTVGGATSSTLTITDAQNDESGNEYDALYTNALDAVASAAATLTVVYNNGGSAPSPELAAVAGSTTFTSTSAGASPAATELWQISTNGGTSWTTLVNGTQSTNSVVAGATTATLTLSKIASSQVADEYRAAFTNTAGTVDSAAAELYLAEESDNWSGYADTAETFTSVAGSWTVPTVTCPGSGNTYASEWVGIDGFNGSTVEQDGSTTACLSGTPSYSAWYEMYGDSALDGGDEVLLPVTSYPVSPGDVMSASVSVTGTSWTLTITDSSKKDSWASGPFSTTVSFSGAAEASAEWIVERPEVCNPGCALTTLTNFGSVTFTNAAVTTSTSSGTIDIGDVNPLEMGVGNTDYALPTLPADAGSQFTDTWESN